MRPFVVALPRVRGSELKNNGTDSLKVAAR
jgi:hypothetical protein